MQKGEEGTDLSIHERGLVIRHEAETRAAEAPVVVQPKLTARESRVLELIAEGLATHQVARTLHVSDQAVTYHVGNLLSKFNCGNRAGLVARAYAFGYLDPQSWPPKLGYRGTMKQQPAE